MKTLNKSLSTISTICIFVISFLITFSAFSDDSKKILKHPNMENRYIVVDEDAELIQRMIEQSDNAKQSESQTSIKQLLAAADKEGPGVGGGGFSYTRGAIKHTIDAVEMVTGFLNQINEDEFQLLQSKWKSKYPSKADLLLKIAGVQLNINEQTYAKGLMGLEPLMADFRIINERTKYVVLQKKLFDTFNNESDAAAVPAIARIILHEISHLYEIGLTSDEESFELSSALINQIVKANQSLQSNKSIIAVQQSKAKKIDILQVVRASESNKTDAIEAVTLVEIESSATDVEPKYVLHLASSGLNNYDRSQIKILGARVCEKLKHKLNSHLKWSLEYSALIGSTYGYYCTTRP